MGLAHEHELHRRRFSRNLGVGLVLFALVALIMGLTIVKMKAMDPIAIQQEFSQ